MYKVSVCLATYNGEDFIHEQLLSILKQIGKEDEVIISDDGSTDSTIAIIKGFNDKRIKLLFNSSNVIRKSYGTILMKIALNFKNSILHATGDIIFLSDQDDIWCSNKYSTIIKAFENDKNVGLIVHNAVVYSNSTENSLELFSIGTKPTASIWGTLKNNPYLGCCMAFRRNIAIRAFANNYLVIPHDTWVALVACSEPKGTIEVIDVPLMYYRVHSSNNSFFMKSKNSLFFKLYYRFRLIYYLIKLQYSKVIS